MDLTPITTPLIETAGAFFTAAAPLLAAWAIAEFRKRTGIQLDDRAKLALSSAEQTAVGMAQAKLLAGNAKLSDIHVDSALINESVAYLGKTVPDAMAKFGLTPEIMAQKLVGKVGAALAADPSVPTVPVTKDSTTVQEGGASSTQSTTAAAKT